VRRWRTTCRPASSFPNIFLPAGFRIEKVVEGLTYPTALTFDAQGRMYVAEAGGAFLEEPPPPRILRIENGTATQVVNLDPFVRASVVVPHWAIRSRGCWRRAGSCRRGGPGAQPQQQRRSTSREWRSTIWRTAAKTRATGRSG
jgi:hypothetical protein